MSYAAWVITVRDAARGEAVAERLSARLGAPVYPVVDPGGLGNLGGTLHAWHNAREQLQPHLLAGQPVAIVHDAGDASRSRPLSTSAGSRGSIVLPGEVAPLVPRTQLDAVIDGLIEAGRGAGPAVDVHWGSQVVICPPLPALHEGVDLAKLARPWRPGRFSPDLGLLRHDGTHLRAFHLAGSLASHAEVSALGDPSTLAQDIGSFRVRPELLDALPLTEADLDPGLLRPLLAGEREGPLSAHRIGVLLVPQNTLWQRLRRPSEHLSAALELFSDPSLRRALGIAHPVTRSALGNTWVEGPELSWSDVERGVTIGGVRLERSWVLGSTLAPDSQLCDAGAAWTLGRVELEAAVCIGVQAPEIAASGSLVYGVRTTEGLRARQAVLAGTSDGIAEAPIHVDARRQPSMVQVRPGATAPARVHPGSPLPDLEADLNDALAAKDPSRLVPWLTHPSPAAARAATRAWLRPLMERCDTLDPNDRDDVLADLCELWPAMAGRTEVPEVNTLPGAATLLRQALKLRSRPPRRPDALQSIAVLSRVTIGADLHVLRPALHALHEAHPTATITLLAPPTSLDLLGDLPGVRGFRLAYARGGALTDRLASWASVRSLLDELQPDVVVSPDTRIDQLGTLPLLDGRTLFLDTTVDDDDPVSLAERVHAQICDWLGTTVTPVPALALSPSGPPLPHTVAMKLGVGGDASKQLSVQEERAWLRGHLQAGRRVLLDLGVGDEVERSAAVLEGLEHTDVGSGVDAAVLTFSGPLLDWARQVARCAWAQGYDSVQGHLARSLGVPTHVVFVGHRSQRFKAAWTPPGARALDRAELGSSALLEALMELE